MSLPRVVVVLMMLAVPAASAQDPEPTLGVRKCALRRVPLLHVFAGQLGHQSSVSS